MRLPRKPDAGNPHVRFGERRVETELGRGVRHRHGAKAAGQLLPPSPTATAPLVDSTRFESGPAFTAQSVSAVRGARTRYVGIFSYTEDPDMVAAPERCQQLYGRVLPIHFERAGQRADTLLD